MMVRVGICATVLMIAPLGSSAFANDACVFEKPSLNCGSNSAAILDAMAEPETLALIQGLRVPAAAYIDGDEREAFRKSLEANRKASQRHADRAFRQWKRKRMSADDYEIVRTKFERAMQAYSAGMNVYRDATWFSTVKPHQAD